MAIAVIEKATIIIPQSLQDEALRLLQGFQRLELIDSGGRSELPLKTAEIGEWEESLSKVTKAQTIISPFTHESMIKKLKNGRPEMTLTALESHGKKANWQTMCADIIALNERLNQIRARRQEIIRLLENWSPWKSLSFTAAETKSVLKYTGALIGTVHSAEYISFRERFFETAGDCGYCEAIFEHGDRTGIMLFYPKSLKDEVLSISISVDFMAFNFPYPVLPAEMLAQWEEEEAGIVKEEADILKKLSDYASSKPQLDLAEEFLCNLLIRSGAKQMLESERRTSHISGWIAQADAASLEALLNANLKLPYYVIFEPVSEEEISKAPTLLKNNKFVSAFEQLTEMYSMPAYDDVDPTPVMTPFYLVFFGMMVADIGYGLVLMLGTLLVKLFFKPDRDLRKNIDFFFSLSFPTMVWGLIYGSFFGVSLPFALLSTSTDIMPIMILSIIFGWLQLMTGLSMNIYIGVKKKDVLGMLSGGVAWMAFLVGLALLAVSKIVLSSNVLFYIGVGLCVIAALGIILLPIAENKKHKVKGVLKGLYDLYGATSYIGDLVSYTRLMALGIAGGSIAVAFNTIIGSLPLAARLTVGVVLAVVLQALNLFLSLLGAYVHGIRLQYVEFFGKFYSGGGRKFSPFKTAEKNIYLIDEYEFKHTEETV